MLRTTSLLRILPLLLLAHAGYAAAQPVSAAPPKLERIEEGSDTPVTVTPPKSGGTKITEKKADGGRVTEVKVKSGNSSYTMKPNTPAGNGVPGDATSSTLRAPQWQVMEFGKKKNTSTEDVPVDTTPAPPPPPPKPSK